MLGYFYPTEEERRKRRRKATLIEFHVDDVNMIDFEDEVDVGAKPTEKVNVTKALRLTRLNNIYFITVVATPTPSLSSQNASMPPSSSRTLRSQKVLEKIISTAYPFELVSSVMVGKIAISTMMENGVDENPLMLKAFEFVNKVSHLNMTIFSFKIVLSLFLFMLCLSLIFYCFCQHW